MDRVNRKIKGFKGVFDGLRQTVTTPTKPDTVEETLRSEHFQIAKTVRHGFPYQPTAMAWDSVQHLLAIGTRTGSIRIFGRPGVDCHMKHEGEVAVLQILFLVNEGAMITACADDTIHLWNLRQKKPEIVHSLKFQRERITYCYLPFQSKWLYVGSERGNVHIVNIESFVLSGYVINWNKAIELSRKTHPGPLVHLSSNPQDPNKLLIGYETGLLVLWDLRSKTVDLRFNGTEPLKSVCWNQDGKQLMSSHIDGSLHVWNVRAPGKPQSVLLPHAKMTSEGKPEPCRAIHKVEWKCARNGDPYIVFSGGMPYDRALRSPSITVMHGKSTTVLEMEHDVIDFITLSNTPWDNDLHDVYGIVVLLQNDLVVIDLTTPGYPCYENPYPMDLHESAVTACRYLADCPTDLIPALYQVGFKQKKTGFSEKEWPVKGGEWGTTSCSYPEIIITGHADGSVKFWDASAATLQFLYKLKTNRLFDKSKCRTGGAGNGAADGGGGGGGDPLLEDPFALQHLHLCPETRLLVVAGALHCALFRFSKQETQADCTVLEICIMYEVTDDTDSPYNELPPAAPSTKPSLGSVSQQSGSVGSYSSACSEARSSEALTPMRVKSGSKKWSAGYVPELCCVLQWLDCEPPPPITSVSLHARFGLMAFGNECGIAIVDLVQKCVLLNMGTPDLYGSMDPYSRAPRSPKNKTGGSSLGSGGCVNHDDNRSPTNEQPARALDASASRKPRPFSLAKITESGESSRLGRPPSADDSQFCRPPLHNLYLDEEMGFRSLQEPPRGWAPPRPLSGPANHRQQASNAVVFELMPSAAERRKKRSPDSASVVAASPPGASRLDLLPDAYEEMSCKSIQGERPPAPPSADTGGDSAGEQPAPTVNWADLESVVPTVKPQPKNHQPNETTESAGDAPVRPERRRKKSFFSKLLDKEDSVERPEAALEASEQDSVMEALVQAELRDSARTNGATRPHDPVFSPPPRVPVTPAVQTTDEFKETEVSEEIQYLESVSEGLRRGSKSDYELLMHSLPQGGRLEGSDAAMSRSSHALSMASDAPVLQSALRRAEHPLKHSTSGGESVRGAGNQSPADPPAASYGGEGVLYSMPAEFPEGYIDHILEELERQRSGKEGGKESLVRRISRKVKSIGRGSDSVAVAVVAVAEEASENLSAQPDKRRRQAELKFEVIDLSADDVAEKPPIKRLTYSMHVAQCADGGSFSRSRSSSMSSLENISKEAIQCLVFTDAYTRKTDAAPCPCLWVGTSLGSVLVVNLQLPADQDRKREPVVVSPSGTIFRLKGVILCMSLLDCNGLPVGGSASLTDYVDSPTRDKRQGQYCRQQSSASLVSNASSVSVDQPIDRQFAIICSERHARVVSLPSQTVVYKHKVTDTSIVAVADVITIKNTVCLACYVANGHIITFSLPSLRPMIDADYLPLTDLRIAKTFQFSSNGHAMYFCSPSELQKLTLSADICDSLDEMLGELFRPCDTPEAPKKTFLQNIFSSGPSRLDREELFGEASSGKASKGVAKYSAGGITQAQERAAHAGSEIARAKMAALERGQKLGQLSDTTDQMRADAEDYARNAHLLMNKYKNKKWYQL